MRILLLDNYDSFTFNLFQALGELAGEAPDVVRNDGATWADLEARGYDRIVISPGPGRCDRPGDFGVCRDAILHARVPLLGVCLGHQGIVAAAGGGLELAPEPIHGRTSPIHHDGSSLFEGIPQGFDAVRYHSWIASPDLPASLVRTAWTADGTVMGVRHRDRPLHGVQFHPESHGTPAGRRLLANFLGRSASARPVPPRAPVEPRCVLRAERVGFPVDAEAAFVALHGDAAEAFWLDSSVSSDARSRWSYLGVPSGLVARLDAGLLEVVASGRVRVTREDPLAWLERELDARRVGRSDVPFAFRGGFVGWLGYELRGALGFPVHHRGEEPAFAVQLVERFLAFDHATGEVWLAALAPEEAAADAWIAATRAQLASVPPPPPFVAPVLSFAPDRDTYLAEIAACQAEIRAGESFELCLTTQLRSPTSPDPLSAYRALRRASPAPFAAYLRFGDIAVVSASPERFLRVSSEGRVEARPIKGTAPRGETPEADAALAAALASGEKTRSENLMIVDLLRNDLGSVCWLGSVDVPGLMEVETYASVHQLVSTVRGQLEPGRTALDAVRAAFPGGSMTGAPKRRSMEILERIEGAPRGVYSGALGWFGVDGALDLSIVIRTAVITPRGTSIGAGGAIVALSDPASELEEMRLKARSVTRAWS